MTTAAELIDRLDLVPLPDEGGHYRETWRAEDSIPADALPERYPGERRFGTAILYLLTSEPDSFSAIHRLPTDEVYHFHLGDPVEILLLRPGGESETLVLGPDVLGGHRVQLPVPRGVWQGSRVVPGGEWALMGTTMAPGFEFADYEPGDRDALIERWPDRAGEIRALTREEP